MEIYFDNGTTSWPKAPGVGEAMKRFIEEIGSSDGRGGHHRAIQSGRMVYEVRDSLTQLLGAKDSSQIIFTLNATEAINVVLKGLVLPGDRVVTSSMEHNSVMRPLRRLRETYDIEVVNVQCDLEGHLDLEAMEGAIDERTALVALTHSSNVTGTLMPIEQVIPMAHAKGAKILVDAAQTAGCVPMNVEVLEVDFLAASGHKSLLGPHGVGVLYIAEGIELRPLKEGGTGSNSEQDIQPDFWPDKFESGTKNTVGIIGLGEGVRFVLEKGVEEIHRVEKELVGYFLDGLSGISEVSVYGPETAEGRTTAVSINLTGWEAAELAYRLDESFGIMGRPGLHCAPYAHRTIGTIHTGTYRLVPGVFTTKEEVDYVLKALEQLARERG